MIITVYGVDFAVDGSGFIKNNASDDFERGVDVVCDYLRRMTAADVLALHAASIKWVETGCEGDRPAKLDAIETAAEKAATEGWHNPGAVNISVSATR